MNPLSQSILLSVIFLNTALGILVYATGRHVAVNRQFLFLTTNLALWMSPFCMALNSTESEPAALFWIRLASAIGAFVPISSALLYQTIGHPDRSIKEVIVRGKYFIYAGIVFAIFSCTSWYIEDVEIGSGIPKPVFGSLYQLFSLCFLVPMGYILVGSLRGLRGTHGAERLEFQYVFVGVVMLLLVGAPLAVVLPEVTGKQDFVKYSPLAVLLMDGIIAYGIATKRILNVNLVARRAVCYGLLGIYLAGLYLGVYKGTAWFINDPHVPHIVAAVLLVATMAPVRSFLTLFIERIFVRAHEERLQQIIQRATADLSSVTTTDEVKARFHDALRRAAGTDEITIRLGEPEREGIEALWDYLRDSGGSILSGMLQRIGWSGRMRKVAGEMEAHGCSLAIGVHSSKRFLGVVLLGEKLKGPGYDQLQQEDLQIIVDQFGNAVENAELYSEVQRANIYNEILLDSLVSGVVAIDPARNITVMNREARRIFEHVGCHAEPPHAVDALPAQVHEVFARILGGGEPPRGIESEFVNGEGEKLDVTMGGAAFSDEDGAPLGALVVLHDVTTEKQLESHVEQSEKLAQVGRFSAGMAHEIKNPLSLIKTLAQLLPERQEDNTFVENFSEQVEGEVDRIADLVSDLLSYARNKEPKFAFIRLHDVIDRVMGFVSPTFRESRVILSSSFKTEIHTIFGDEDQIRQVLINILLNAQQAIGTDGKVGIETEAFELPQGGMGISVTVTDDGAGMTPEQLEKAFKPFFTTRENGSGLGLAMAAKLMDRHKGSISITSEPGVGTAVRLVFPLLSESHEGIEMHPLHS